MNVGTRKELCGGGGREEGAGSVGAMEVTVCWSHGPLSTENFPPPSPPPPYQTVFYIRS